jgi:hypothetical protein
MRVPFDFKVDSKLHATFSWLTAQGMGRYFGSMPIGWYQAHQCAAMDVIEEAAGGPPGDVRVRNGMVEFRADGTRGFKKIISTNDVFQRADNRARGI